MKKCALFKKEEDRVRCTACAHYCLISDGRTGICGVRKNIKGKLYLLVYGKVVSRNVDPIEKKPLYHFLPESKAYSIGTVGCNFFCKGCQNYDISQQREISGVTVTSNEVISSAIKYNCKSLAYTYNEPTIFAEFVKDCAKIAKKKGLKNILVTNGYMSKEGIDFLSQYIDAMNIDLKSFSDDFYKKNCGARLQPVLNTIKMCHKKRIWIEITTLIIPGENDSEKELKKIAKFIAKVDKNIPWHISRFFPMYKMQQKNPTKIKSLEKAYKMGKKYLNNVYIGNLHKESNTYCPMCKTIVIKRFDYSTKNNLKGNKCQNCGNEIEGVFG